MQVHLRVVGFERRHLLIEEAVDARAVAMPFRVREVRQHFGYGESVRRGLPRGVFFREFAHEPAQDIGRRFQQFETRQLRRRSCVSSCDFEFARPIGQRANADFGAFRPASAPESARPIR